MGEMVWFIYRSVDRVWEVDCGFFKAYVARGKRGK